ncbi:uncharacterized protein CTRU02_205200 [Colletotrichum truncatum]|uniref:Uncharacterized protein n=1 Tax=Colletotrichum truncatum TaxID=5467 RepID=A0ACC3Z3F0_COLTU|nr:uncharacterized protein CTRU02_05978 [Colletotrichum truncatum]KAF6793106.1 hypothetical protein CTRU02_05978 [Colletotrichum truncatum]
MRSTSFLPLFVSSTLVAVATAESCCWGDNWAYTNWLWQKWDEPAGVVRCGLGGNFPPGTKCTVENSKDSKGNIQAVTNVTFGGNSQPFRFRIGIDPNSCDTLPNDKVITGWEGWGAYLFKSHEFNPQRLESCTQDHAA